MSQLNFPGEQLPLSQFFRKSQPRPLKKKENGPPVASGSKKRKAVAADVECAEDEGLAVKPRKLSAVKETAPVVEGDVGESDARSQGHRRRVSEPAEGQSAGSSTLRKRRPRASTPVTQATPAARSRLERGAKTIAKQRVQATFTFPTPPATVGRSSIQAPPTSPVLNLQATRIHEQTVVPGDGQMMTPVTLPRPRKSAKGATHADPKTTAHHPTRQASASPKGPTSSPARSTVAPMRTLFGDDDEELTPPPTSNPFVEADMEEDMAAPVERIFSTAALPPSSGTASVSPSHATHLSILSPLTERKSSLEHIAPTSPLSPHEPSTPRAVTPAPHPSDQHTTNHQGYLGGTCDSSSQHSGALLSRLPNAGPAKVLQPGSTFIPCSQGEISPFRSPSRRGNVLPEASEIIVPSSQSNENLQYGLHFATPPRPKPGRHDTIVHSPKVAFKLPALPLRLLSADSNSSDPCSAAAECGSTPIPGLISDQVPTEETVDEPHTPKRGKTVATSQHVQTPEDEVDLALLPVAATPSQTQAESQTQLDLTSPPRPIASGTMRQLMGSNGVSMGMFGVPAAVVAQILAAAARTDFRRDTAVIQEQPRPGSMVSMATSPIKVQEQPRPRSMVDMATSPIKGEWVQERRAQYNEEHRVDGMLSDSDRKDASPSPSTRSPKLRLTAKSVRERSLSPSVRASKQTSLRSRPVSPSPVRTRPYRRRSQVLANSILEIDSDTEAEATQEMRALPINRGQVLVRASQPSPRSSHSLSPPPPRQPGLETQAAAFSIPPDYELQSSQTVSSCCPEGQSFPTVVNDFMDMFESGDGSWPADFPESLR